MTDNNKTAWAGPSVLPSRPAADPERPSVTILYASSTGTAEDVAHRIQENLERARFKTRCASFDSYDVTSLIDETHVLFVVATTGAGEFPQSALKFWNFLLRDGLPHDILSDVHSAVFALGDSSYPRFCWPARKLTRRLNELGAQDLLPLSDADPVPEGDDQHPLGLEGALGPWLERLYSKLKNTYPPRAQYPPIAQQLLLPPRVRVRLRPSPSAEYPNGSSKAESSPAPTAVSAIHASTNGAPEADEIFVPPDWHAARLLRNERVTDASHFQDVRAIEWERTDRDPIIYKAGDVACLLPENDPKDVERLLKRMGWDKHADALVDLEIEEGGEPLPSHIPRHPITLRKLIASYLTPMSVPRRSFFAFLRNFTPPDHLEHEKLTEFLTPGEGTDEMFEYAQRVRRTCLEVLEEFKSVQNIGPEWAVEMFGWMQERKFSIASSPAVSPNRIELAVAMVKYRTRLREPRRGICTSWLSRLEPTTSIGELSSAPAAFAFRIEAGTMRLPPSDNTPIILVGPGTGVAPMRSLAYERLSRLRVDVAALTKASDGHADAPKVSQYTPIDTPLPNILLFLGCRYSQRDFLFGNEWHSLSILSHHSSTEGQPVAGSAGEQSGSEKRGYGLLHYELAASRDSEDGSKTYVQDKIRSQGALVWKLLSQAGAYVYISGSSGKMPEAVRESIKQAVIEHGQIGDEFAERYLDGLESKGRWQEECWS
ncbi:NAPDH-dependent diflavin reductase [Tilletia horrida]|nr:NAPDH-dependent diflavin reductase [Tilletia horrida]